MAEGLMGEALEVDMCFRDSALATVDHVMVLRDPRTLASDSTLTHHATARIIAHPDHTHARVASDSKYGDAVL
jgi:hypothetical protein